LTLSGEAAWAPSSGDFGTSGHPEVLCAATWLLPPHFPSWGFRGSPPSQVPSSPSDCGRSQLAAWGWGRGRPTGLRYWGGGSSLEEQTTPPVPLSALEAALGTPRARSREEEGLGLRKLERRPVETCTQATETQRSWESHLRHKVGATGGVGPEEAHWQGLLLVMGRER
jgi:hypothetical protein